MPASRLTVTTGQSLPPSCRTFETVERKGLGHPDTLADLVAETFCYRYAHYCHDEFGAIPNHSADKVTLAGADAIVSLGGYRIVQPIGAYYFGKVSRKVGGSSIPVQEIFASAVSDVLRACTRSAEIADHVTAEVKAVVGRPADHSPGYYNPESAEQLRSIVNAERCASDTVACAASADRSPVERMVIELEHYLQGTTFGRLVPGTGSDTKVLATRHGRALDITTCVPFHPETVRSWADYQARVDTARSVIGAAIEAMNVDGVDEYSLHLNTRDVPGRGYLAPFGTALGKGDVGAVGRGNRHSGLITLGRAMSVEAPAGKNLVHQAGKIYTVLAQWIADAIHAELGVNCEVIMTTHIGDALDSPASVFVDLATDLVDPEKVDAIVEREVSRVYEVTDLLLDIDPLARVRHDYYAGSESMGD